MGVFYLPVIVTTSSLVGCMVQPLGQALWIALLGWSVLQAADWYLRGSSAVTKPGAITKASALFGKDHPPQPKYGNRENPARVTVPTVDPLLALTRRLATP